MSTDEICEEMAKLYDQSVADKFKGMVNFLTVFSHFSTSAIIGGRTIWRYSVFANFLGGDTVIWIKNGRYSVFQSPNGDGKIQLLIESTTVTVFVQKFDYIITVIFEKINGNTVL